MTDAPLAVVTGASSGIGEQFAHALLARGHRVLAVARRGDRLAELEAGSNGRLIPLVADLADGGVETVAARIEELGGAELVVANAGRGIRGRFVEMDPADVTAMLQLNVLGTVELASHVLPVMTRRGHGGLIVVSSSAGFYPTPYFSAYSASKAFLLSFGEGLAEEVRGTGVRVMVVCPGPVSTEFGAIAGSADFEKGAPGLMSAAEVVTAALKAWDAGRSVVLPGRTTRVMTTVLDHLPRPLARRAMARVFRPRTRP